MTTDARRAPPEGRRVGAGVRAALGGKKTLPIALWIAIAGLAMWLHLGSGVGARAQAIVDVRQATLVAPVAAAVAAAPRRTGDAVRAGDVLVELASPDVELDLAVAGAELERARSLVSARAFSVKGEAFDARTRLAQEAERASVDLAAVLSEDQRDRAELAEIDGLLARQDKLVAQRLASAEQRDALRLRRASIAERVRDSAQRTEAARRHEAAARARLHSYGAGGEGDDARTAPERAEVRAYEAKLEQLRAARAALTLRAPFDGRLVQIAAAGAVLQPGEVAASVIDEQPRQATAWIEEHQAGLVRVGDVARLAPSDGRGGERSGKVRALGPGIVEVPVRLRQLPGEPMFGRPVFIDLDLGSAGSGAGAIAPLPGQRFDVTFSRGSP
jgi:multidrug resistance efflux pump